MREGGELMPSLLVGSSNRRGIASDLRYRKALSELTRSSDVGDARAG